MRSGVQVEKGGGGGGGGLLLLDEEDSLIRSSVLVFIWFLCPREHSVLSECFFFFLLVFVCCNFLFHQHVLDLPEKRKQAPKEGRKENTGSVSRADRFLQVCVTDTLTLNPLSYCKAGRVWLPSFGENRIL